jgi:hypothetical protein
MNNYTMTLSNNPGQAGQELDSASPFNQEFFMVQACGFRCMAYRGSDGKWRGAFDHKELPEIVRVVE